MEVITDTPKPPMVVWLQNQQSLNEEQWQDDDVTWCRDKIFKHDVGPYVHLDQFMAEVERRMMEAEGNGLVGNKWAWAIKELAKELKEQ